MIKTLPKISFLLLFLFGLSTSSCNRFAEGIEFDFNIDGSFKVPKGIPANTGYDLPTLPVPVDVSKTFQSKGTNSDLIKEIKMKSFELKVEEPAGGEIDFLDEVEIRFFKEGVGEKLVAWKYNIQNNVSSSIFLNTTPDPLDAYLKQGDFEMRVKVKLSKVTTQDYTLAYDIIASVKADLFK